MTNLCSTKLDEVWCLVSAERVWVQSLWWAKEHV